MLLDSIDTDPQSARLINQNLECIKLDQSQATAVHLIRPSNKHPRQLLHLGRQHHYIIQPLFHLLIFYIGT